MQMYNAQQANEIALDFFPEWMDINKRFRTSRGGKLLSSFTEEQNSLCKEFKDFEQSFFLKTYDKKENEVLETVWIALVGELSTIVMKCPVLEVTESAREFLRDTKKYVLYQSGYLIFGEDPGKEIKYETVDNYIHTAETSKQHLWNIFDEYALFSGIDRYDGETNAELVKRIYAVYRNPTSSAETGLKNAIINSVINYDNLLPEEITFEEPDENNIFEETDSGKTIYDEISELNQDNAKDKVWNQSYWENTFKKTTYIPNEWDKEIPVYQNGTGQSDDLKVKMSSDSADETTDIYVTGYKASQVTVNEYIRKQGIQKTIPIKLRRYRDELVAKDVRYKITASDAQEIDPNTIYVNSKQHITGEIKTPLSEIILDKGNLTEETGASPEIGQKYSLTFYPKSEYSDMTISKCDLVYDDKTSNSLLREQGAFKFDNGALRNTDVKFHITKVKTFDSYDNMVDNAEGFTLGDKGTVGTMDLDVSGLEGQLLMPSYTCREMNYTNDENFVKTTGSFTLIDSRNIESHSVDSTSTVTIDINCNSLSYTFAAASDIAKQGTISIMFSVDGQLDAEKSGLYTKAQTFHYEFDHLARVKVVITKSGMLPVTIRDIKAARYTVSYSFDNGEMIYAQNYMRLPIGYEKNTLHVRVVSMSTYAPQFYYIHIGPSLLKSSYTISDIQIDKKSVFDIDTNCRIELSKNGKVIDEDYDTHTTYVNKTSAAAPVIIDISKYSNITASVPAISSIAYHGSSAATFSVKPGERIRYITFTGEVTRGTGEQTLSDVLGLGVDDKLFVSGTSDGFIIKNGDKTRIVSIRPRDLPVKSDQFEFSGLPDNIRGIFVLDALYNNTIENSKITSAAFDHCFLRPTKYNTYVAYNSVQLLQSPMENVPVINTFFPAIPNGKLIYMVVESPTLDSGEKIDIQFTKPDGEKTYYTDWSLGENHLGLRIAYDFEFGNDASYQLDINNLNESFTLSNNIELEDAYLVNGEKLELARYILTPPDDMKISYEKDAGVEEAYIEEDGFNKLWYSNISEIIDINCGGKKLPESTYTLLKEPGIITWKLGKEYIGQKVKITYRYLRPKKIEFKDISSLYEIIGYPVEAYEIINKSPIVYKKLKDGDQRDLKFSGGPASRIVVHTNNSDFYTTLSGSVVTIHRYPRNRVAIVQSGYYYDGKDEYYLYSDDNTDEVNRMEDIELKNISRTANTFQGSPESNNYALDTVMTNGDHLEKICVIDCHDDQDRIEGISDFKATTACDSYQLWRSFGMKIALYPSINGLGINFQKKESAAYALLNITKAIKSNYWLSFYADAGIDAYIMEEIMAGTDHMARSIFCQSIGQCDRDNKYLTYHFSDLDEDKRYYLCIMGSGTIDDILLEDSLDETRHTKLIDSIKLDIPEQTHKRMLVKEAFSPEGNREDNAEIAVDGTIETGSSIDWGVTRIAEFKDNFDEFVGYRVGLKKNAFYTGTEAGTITSPWTYVPDHENVLALYIKLNDVLVDGFRFFNIHVQTASTQNGDNMREVLLDKKINMVSIGSADLDSFVRIVVEIPAARVIENIEIYARYAENAKHDLHVLPRQEGSIITKVYDLVTSANYRLRRIEGSATNLKNIEISVRGCREDDNSIVWTDWYPAKLNNRLGFSDSHVFQDYRYFQLKIEINDTSASIKIDNIVFEVAS